MKRGPSHARKLPGGTYAYELLDRLARILVKTGHSPKDLEREFRAICRRYPEPRRAWQAADLAFVADLPHILAYWHADPAYLDSRGRPAPLPLKSRGPSLTALIKRVLPHEDVRSVAESLIRARAVRYRTGRYLPTTRLVVHRRHQAHVHALNTVMGMLRTVASNISSRGESTILERTAINPNFPVQRLEGFNRELKTRAEKILWGVDGDMRRHEATGKGPRIRLGVGIFAFQEPLTRTSRGPRTKRTRRRTKA
jgi:hypothetical protein